MHIFHKFTEWSEPEDVIWMYPAIGKILPRYYAKGQIQRRRCKKCKYVQERSID